MFDLATSAGMKNAALFLDYYNDFLTVRGFASYYGLSVKEAAKVIKKGRIIHEDNLGILPSEIAVNYN